MLYPLCGSTYGRLSHLTTSPTNRGIADAQMVTGRFVAVLSIDDANPSDMVVIAVWT